MYVEFVNPYYASTVRDYVAVPFPTGETVRLISDGEILCELQEPGTSWPAEFAEIAGISAAATEALDTQDSFE
jgi:hypothetical protein